MNEFTASTHHVMSCVVQCQCHAVKCHFSFNKWTINSHLFQKLVTESCATDEDNVIQPGSLCKNKEDLQRDLKSSEAQEIQNTKLWFKQLKKREVEMWNKVLFDLLKIMEKGTGKNLSVNMVVIL